MWRPVEAARATQRIVDDVSPDAIIVDHLAFSARLGLTTAGIPHGDIVLGHPTALPVGSEVYGYPPTWPDAFRPGADELEELLRLCRRVSARFTEEWNRAALELSARCPAELRRVRRARPAGALQLPRGARRRRASPPPAAAPLPGVDAPRRARGPRGGGLARHGGPVRLRELRELPLGARRRAPAGGRRAPHARRPGGDRDRVDGCRRARRTARRAGWCATTCPRCGCSARPPPP